MGVAIFCKESFWYCHFTRILQSGSLLASLGNYFPSSMLKTTILVKSKVEEIDFFLLSRDRTAGLENDKYELLPPFNFPNYKSFQYQSN